MYLHRILEESIRTAGEIVYVVLSADRILNKALIVSDV